MVGLNIAIDDNADPEEVCAEIESGQLEIEEESVGGEELVKVLADRLSSGSQAFIKETMERHHVPENVLRDPLIQGMVQARIDTCRTYIEENRGSREEVVGELIEDSWAFIQYLEKTFKINSN